jgi:hypothetical protein
MESLLERIEENRLDALYLFINESLRDRVNFDRFFLSLVSLLPLNWSIQRVEIGHEFLSMVEDQLTLFTKIAEMESIRTLIVSDGYVPRKDHGTIHTASLLEALPRARNLTILDVQRLELADADQVQDLADVFETMQESLEEVRITGLHLRTAVSLDPVLTAWIDMSNLRALALSTHPETKVTDSNSMMSQNALKALLQDSTTLQDLTLRSMHLNDDQCQTIAGALNTNSFLTSLDIRQNPNIGEDGYNSILEALEHNHGLWCSVMVDSHRFQGLFNLLIELNQAGRGDLLRSPSLAKLGTFMGELHDPTALWFFLRIHDTIRDPLVAFLQWKSHIVRSKQGGNTEDETTIQQWPAKRARTEAS